MVSMCLLSSMLVAAKLFLALQWPLCSRLAFFFVLLEKNSRIATLHEVVRKALCGTNLGYKLIRQVLYLR